MGGTLSLRTVVTFWRTVSVPSKGNFGRVYSVEKGFDFCLWRLSDTKPAKLCILPPFLLPLWHVRGEQNDASFHGNTEFWARGSCQDENLWGTESSTHLASLWLTNGNCKRSKNVSVLRWEIMYILITCSPIICIRVWTGLLALCYLKWNQTKHGRPIRLKYTPCILEAWFS